MPSTVKVVSAVVFICCIPVVAVAMFTVFLPATPFALQLVTALVFMLVVSRIITAGVTAMNKYYDSRLD